MPTVLTANGPNVWMMANVNASMFFWGHFTGIALEGKINTSEVNGNEYVMKSEGLDTQQLPNKTKTNNAAHSVHLFISESLSLTMFSPLSVHYHRGVINYGEDYDDHCSPDTVPYRPALMLPTPEPKS